VCLDFADTNTDGTAKVAACDALKTSFSASSESYTAGTGNDCSTASRVGSCTVSNGTLRYYSGSNWDAGSAQTNCTSTQSGTFTAN
jgi:hypothetical protein